MESLCTGIPEDSASRFDGDLNNSFVCWQVNFAGVVPRPIVPQG